MKIKSGCANSKNHMGFNIFVSAVYLLSTKNRCASIIPEYNLYLNIMEHTI